MTLKLSLKKFGVQTARLAFSCSCVVAIATASAQSSGGHVVFVQGAPISGSVYAALDKELQGAADAYAAQKIIASHADELKGDTQLLTISKAEGAKLKDIKNAVELREVATHSTSVPGDLNRMAAGATSGLLSGGNGKKAEANWLSNSLDNIGNLFKFQDRHYDTPNISPSGSGGAMGFLQFLAWTLLAVVAVAMIVAVVKSVRVDGIRKKRHMIDDDEPDRTLDEWLVLADQHESNGDFRQAVRCLYVACLMRFDEAGIAAFVRGQTNWEHLTRIRNSTRLPKDLDFVTPTQEFDRIWYGMRVRGKEDVELFRFTYRLVCDQLRGKAA